MLNVKLNKTLDNLFVVIELKSLCIISCSYLTNSFNKIIIDNSTNSKHEFDIGLRNQDHLSTDSWHIKIEPTAVEKQDYEITLTWFQKHDNLSRQIFDMKGNPAIWTISGQTNADSTINISDLITFRTDDSDDKY